MQSPRGPLTTHVALDETVDDRGPGRLRKLFVLCFLSVFAITGLADVEAWPFTGWRMYSHLRDAERWKWQVLAVGPDGTERPVGFTAAFHGVPYVLGGFDERTETEKQEICRGLGQAAVAQQDDVVSVAVDRTLEVLSTDGGKKVRKRVRSVECRL